MQCSRWWLQPNKEVCHSSTPMHLSWLNNLPDTSNPVIAVGTVEGAEKSRSMAAPQLVVSRTSTTGSHAAVSHLAITPRIPALNIPAPQAQHASASSRFPSLSSLKPAPIKLGYQEAHQYYCEMREHFASKAYISISNAELVVTKVWLMTHAPTKKKPMCVSVCVEHFVLRIIMISVLY